MIRQIILILTLATLVRAEPVGVHELEMRVLASADPKDELRLSELVDDPKYIVHSFPQTALPEERMVVVSVPSEARLSPRPTTATSENCQLLLSPEKEHYQIRCEWLVSETKGRTKTTEYRNYVRDLNAGAWAFTHYGQRDAFGRERYLAFRLVEK